MIHVHVEVERNIKNVVEEMCKLANSKTILPWIITITIE